jgi:hypothetical protein
MSKENWYHIILFFHMAGLACILLLPLAAFMMRTQTRSRDWIVSARMSQFMKRVDLIAIIGAALLLFSGFGQMWAHNIGFNSLSHADTKWLGVKLVLFVIVVVLLLGILTPIIFRRSSLLNQLAQSSQPTTEQDTVLANTFNWLYIGVAAMGILVVVIIYLATFQPSF